MYVLNVCDVLTMYVYETMHSCKCAVFYVSYVRMRLCIVCLYVRFLCTGMCDLRMFTRFMNVCVYVCTLAYACMYILVFMYLCLIYAYYCMQICIQE